MCFHLYNPTKSFFNFLSRCVCVFVLFYFIYYLFLFIFFHFDVSSLPFVLFLVDK